MQFPGIKAGFRRFFGMGTEPEPEAQGKKKAKPEGTGDAADQGIGVAPPVIDLPGPIDLGFDGKPTFWPGADDRFTH